VGRRLGAAEVHSRTQPASPSPRLVTSPRPQRPYAGKPSRATVAPSHSATTSVVPSVFPAPHPTATGAGTTRAAARPLRPAATTSASSAFPHLYPIAHGTEERAAARPPRPAASASLSSAFPDPHPTAGVRQAYGVLDDSGDRPAAW
jgi:hypothetical protein